MAHVTAPAINAPAQAIRRARRNWRAPLLVPTMAMSAAPMPKVRGLKRYSRRLPTP